VKLSEKTKRLLFKPPDVKVEGEDPDPDPEEGSGNEDLTDRDKSPRRSKSPIPEKSPTREKSPTKRKKSPQPPPVGQRTLSDLIKRPKKVLLHSKF
jgi:hypothetical protein